MARESYRKEQREIKKQEGGLLADKKLRKFLNGGNGT